MRSALGSIAPSFPWKSPQGFATPLPRSPQTKVVWKSPRIWRTSWTVSERMQRAKAHHIHPQGRTRVLSLTTPLLREKGGGVGVDSLDSLPPHLEGSAEWHAARAVVGEMNIPTLPVEKATAPVDSSGVPQRG